MTTGDQWHAAANVLREHALKFDALAEEAGRSKRNVLAEAFIRGLEVGAGEPDLASDGDAMYDAFRRWYDQHPD